MGDADRLSPVLPLPFDILVHRGHARDRGRTSSDLPGDDLLRMGARIDVPACAEAAQTGLPPADVPGHHLREHVLLRHLAECRPVSERQLVGRHGPRDLLDHRDHDRVRRALHHGVQVPRVCHLREQARDGRHAVPHSVELRRDLGDDGGLRRFRRRRIVHGVRRQRHHGRSHRRSHRRVHHLGLRLLVSGEAHGRGRGIPGEDRQGRIRSVG